MSALRLFFSNVAGHESACLPSFFHLCGQPLKHCFVVLPETFNFWRQTDWSSFMEGGCAMLLLERDRESGCFGSENASDISIDPSFTCMSNAWQPHVSFQRLERFTTARCRFDIKCGGEWTVLVSSKFQSPRVNYCLYFNLHGGIRLMPESWRQWNFSRKLKTMEFFQTHQFHSCFFIDIETPVDIT